MFTQSEFTKNFLGFDSLDTIIDRFNKLNSDVAKTTSTYPPYNIIKVTDNTYKVEIALAGFSKSEIEVEVVNGKLIVKSAQTKVDHAPEAYIFRGISRRDFERAWALQDNMIIQSAEFCNGLLTIALERFTPETMKPRKIDITELTQEQKDAIADKM